MVKYSSPHTRQIASLVPFVCSLVFACFCFCYLYLFQADYLAQFQYRFSHGETTYQPLIGASLITLLLVLLGLFVHRIIRWPLRFAALAWFPSAFLLTAITSVRLPELPDYSTGTPWVAMAVALVVFVLCTILCCMHPDATGERSALSSYLSSNLLVLSLLLFMTGVLGYSSEVGHRELRMGRFVHEGKYADVAYCCHDTADITYRLYSLRAAGLALDGALGDRLFEFPVPAGLSTLMPAQSDSEFVYNALPALYQGMQAVPRLSEKFSEQHFLAQVVALDSIARPLALDYLLCSHLLCGEMHSFAQVLVQHTDSLSTSLPKHYREALVLIRNLWGMGSQRTSSPKPTSTSTAGKAVKSVEHTLFLYSDSLMQRSFDRFCRLYDASLEGNQAAIDSLANYSHTYWAYYASRFQ